jgi:hypothetical protein
MDAGLLPTYRRLYPEGPFQCAGKVCVGDLVKYKRSKKTVEKAWGKIAGTVIEIRSGPSGPTMITASEHGLTSRGIGPRHSVAVMKRGNDYQFSDVKDIAVVKKAKK